MCKQKENSGIRPRDLESRDKGKARISGEISEGGGPLVQGFKMAYSQEKPLEVGCGDALCQTIQPY